MADDLKTTPRAALDRAMGKHPQRLGPFTWWGPAAGAICRAGAPCDVVLYNGTIHVVYWKGRVVAAYDGRDGTLRIDWPAVAERAKELCLEIKVTFQPGKPKLVLRPQEKAVQ